MNDDLIIIIIFAVILVLFWVAAKIFPNDDPEIEAIKRYKNNLTIVDTVRISEELADLLHSKCPQEDYNSLKEEILRILCS